jgi:hypothetical protein
MTFKQWQAVITLVSQVLIAGWLVRDATRHPVLDATVAATATKLMWAMAALIVINIVVNIAIVVAISIAQRKEFKDEKADERDKAVIAKSGRNAQYVLSVAALGTLLMLALGADPVIGAYALFGAMMLAGATDAVSKLIYYRIG